MKKLFTLLICAFAWIGANAQTLTLHNATEAGNVTVAQLSGITKIVLDGNFGGGWSAGELVNAGKDAKTSIKEIDLSNAIFNSDASWSFKNFGNLEKVTWPSNEDASITTIPIGAFEHCGFETLHIPGYITNIASNAIVEASDEHYLKNVIFDEYDADGDGTSDVNMTIGFQAFQLTYGLEDVFVNATGTLTCANNAFAIHQTWVHGDTSLPPTTLHFPEEKAENYYNKNHPLTEADANDDARFHKWLVDHVTAAGQAQNGWYEFVSSGINQKDEWPAQFLMTYSHPKLDQIVPSGVKAYVVNSIEKRTDGKYYLTLKSINVIPAGTGVILFGGANSTTSDGKPALAMTAVDYEGPIYDRTTSIKNYLTATANQEGKKTSVTPYGKDQFNILHRDFAMGKFSSTDSGKKYFKDNGKYGDGVGLANGDWVGFFRTKPCVIEAVNPGKAYLRLTEDEYDLVDGGEIIMDLADQRDGSLGDDEFYRTEYYYDGGLQTYTERELEREHLWYLDNQGTKLEWVKNWGVREFNSDFSMAKYMGEIEDEDWMNYLNTSGLSNVEAKEGKSGDIYNLQGMKVAQPTKGIYIQNGKKYIVK